MVIISMPKETGALQIQWSKKVVSNEDKTCNEPCEITGLCLLCLHCLCIKFCTKWESVFLPMDHLWQNGRQMMLEKHHLHTQHTTQKLFFGCITPQINSQLKSNIATHQNYWHYHLLCINTYLHTDTVTCNNRHAQSYTYRAHLKKKLPWVKSLVGVTPAQVQENNPSLRSKDLCWRHN